MGLLRNRAGDDQGRGQQRDCGLLACIPERQAPGWSEGRPGDDGGVPLGSKGSGLLCLFLLQEVMKLADGSLLGDPGRTPLSKDGVKWQRPRLTRQALMRCCLVKWILSSTAPQGSGRGWAGWEEGGGSVLRAETYPGTPAWATPPLLLRGHVSIRSRLCPFIGACSHRVLTSRRGPGRWGQIDRTVLEFSQLGGWSRASDPRRPGDLG